MPEDPGEPVEKQAYLVAPGRSRLFKSPCCFSNSLTQCSTFFFLCAMTLYGYQRTTYRSHFSFYVMWIMGIELSQA